MQNRHSECLYATLRSRWDGGPYALIDYPLYNNPGDAAIWWGTRIVLERIAGAPPAYVSDLRSFSAPQAHRKVRGGTVFFLGGGNFGALYAKHHRRRLEAIAALHSFRVICLPLSTAGLEIDAHLLAKTSDVLKNHGDVTLIAREEMTRSALRSLLGIDTTMAPDAAHAIPFSQDGEGRGLLKLIRADLEGNNAINRADGTDWTEMPDLRRLNRWGKIAAAVCLGDTRLWLYDRLAERKVMLAARRLSAAKTIETDRLHAAIFASSLGRDLIAHDNSTGKVASYLQTWDLENNGSRNADQPFQADLGEPQAL